MGHCRWLERVGGLCLFDQWAQIQQGDVVLLGVFGERVALGAIVLGVGGIWSGAQVGEDGLRSVGAVCQFVLGCGHEDVFARGKRGTTERGVWRIACVWQSHDGDAVGAVKVEAQPLDIRT